MSYGETHEEPGPVEAAVAGAQLSHRMATGWLLPWRLLSDQRWRVSSGLVSGCWAPGGSSPTPFPPLGRLRDAEPRKGLLQLPVGAHALVLTHEGSRVLGAWGGKQV